MQLSLLKLKTLSPPTCSAVSRLRIAPAPRAFARAKPIRARYKSSETGQETPK
jgi:hypothetical protein